MVNDCNNSVNGYTCGVGSVVCPDCRVVERVRRKLAEDARPSNFDTLRALAPALAELRKVGVLRIKLAELEVELEPEAKPLPPLPDKPTGNLVGDTDEDTKFWSA
jgi:hypothetical protein